MKNVTNIIKHRQGQSERKDTTDMEPTNRAARRAIASNRQPKNKTVNESVFKINNKPFQE
tara:strand:- start:4577 stop:4756 length:180 start_codon:yes stop_codon:yes gene_type:complete